MTREEIDNLQPGQYLQHTLDHDSNGVARPNATWSLARKIVSVHAKDTVVAGSHIGKRFACFYTELGPHSAISGTVREGETAYRLVTG